MLKELSKQDIINLAEKYKDEKIHDVLGLDSLTFPVRISGSRTIMVTTHLSQSVNINNPETAALITGKENAIGYFSDGKTLAEKNYRIIDKISRFSKFPDFKYVLVVQDTESEEYDVIEVQHYEKLSTVHGYIKPYIHTDEKGPGDIIRKGEIISRSNNHDDYGNYRMGVNAKVAMMTLAETQEDPILISESFANRVKFNLIKEINIPINCNDVLLNYFGDENNYRCLPEIGEQIDDKGIICVLRRLITNQAVFSLTWEALRHTQQSDEIYEGKGKIIDIDIIINKLDEFDGVTEPCNYRYQLKELYQDQLRYNRELNATLSKILNPRNGNRSSYRLKFLHMLSSNYINNENPNSNIEIKMRSNTGSIFEFAYLTIKLAYETGLDRGYKLVNRYASKGVVAKVVPDEFMPRDEFGNVAEVIMNATSTISRANPGQNIELELNFINESIVRRIKKMDNLDDKIKLAIGFIKDCNEEQGKELESKLKILSKGHKKEFIESVEEMGYFIIQQNPFHNSMDFEKLNWLYDKYKIEISRVRWKVPYLVKNKSDRYKTKKEWDLIKKQKNYYYSLDENKIYNDYFTQPINIVSVAEQVNKSKLDPIKDKDKIYIWKNDPLTIEKYIKYKNKTKEEMRKLEKKIKILGDRYGEMDSEQFNSEETYVYPGRIPNSIVRDYRSANKTIIANMYMLVLKQVPELGFSVTSIGGVNQVNLPIKVVKKETGSPYSNTPVASGYMEVTNLMRRIEPELVHKWIASHSTNPEVKDKLIEALLTKDPLKLHELPIDEVLNDVPAQMLWAYLFCFGTMVLNRGEEDVYSHFDDLNMDANEFFKIKNKSI